MKTLTTLVTMNALLALAAHADTINFDNAKTGEAPAGWTFTKTGSGKVGVWTKAGSVTLFDDCGYGSN